MYLLTIIDEHDAPVLSVRIPDIDPTLALPAIMEALRKLPKLRKVRADKGQPKTTKP